MAVHFATLGRVSAEDELWALVASGGQGVLATVNPDGSPQLSNMLYVTDPDERVVRMSTTAGRQKVRNLARSPHAALHVAGSDFWHYAVASGTATASAVAASPGDAAVEELLAVHSYLYGEPDRPAFDNEMITARRLVLRLYVDRLHGVLTTAGRRPINRG
jgi:PPOX class probable F420-dependent enzyme